MTPDFASPVAKSTAEGTPMPRATVSVVRSASTAATITWSSASVLDLSVITVADSSSDPRCMRATRSLVPPRSAPISRPSMPRP